MRMTEDWYRGVFILGLGLAACGGDDGSSPTPPPTLEISAMTPAPNATQVETGATVTVTFNQAIDPATLSAATFKLTVGGVALPVAISYDAATWTVRASAPFLPDSTYGVEVTTGVHTTADSALAAAAVWSFATRAWQPVTAHAGNVGQYTSLVVDGSGRRHVTYYNAAVGNLQYATCTSSCTVPQGVYESWGSGTTVDSLGSVGQHTSLAVDGSGRLHVNYLDETNGNLKYATCAGGGACNVAANWQATTVDTSGFVGRFTSLAVDGGGRLHVSYVDDTKQDLKYATCVTACTTGANWQVVTVDSLAVVEQHTSLAVDASGRLHVSYPTSGVLKYATCAAPCATASRWQAVTVDASAVGAYTSLAVDARGRLHVSYTDAASGLDLKYATCAGVCATAANWQAVTLQTVGSDGQFPSLAVDGAGRLHVGFYDFGAAHLKYATCAAACTTAAGWRMVVVDAASFVGTHTAIAVGNNGRIHVTYRDGANSALKYIE